ncbi:MucR family transcriptional regulator [Pseudochelatococcus contaminans]|uniref:Putative transcriptional regulator n=1 Tax=Pseudochelatococcus contaminans TaxID=1538103 RepID=A0A7W5Z367_9HYPH|nr:MucR family transcriptional regulator [Pseudochelatococcus contaminans]MBB3809144.1 putative transcriptional regulator [Pseudochelatococcus contaminans]
MSNDAGEVLSKAGLISVTADIVAAYVANNSLPPTEVLNFIEGVHATFSRLQSSETGSATRVGGHAGSEAGAPGEDGEASDKTLPTQQVDEKLFEAARRRNPPNPVDPRTGALRPLEFEELVPDEDGFVFDPAWIDTDAYVDRKPVVPVEKTVKADSIVCLENGKALKVLKRHLDTEFSMTPDTYRRKWGLTDYYPLVTHAFSTSRSKYAKAQGLGKARTRS